MFVALQRRMVIVQRLLVARRVRLQDCRMIRLENVSKTYHGRNFTKQVFSNLNFTVERGHGLAICGANGSGKTTLMRLLAGIEQPTSGTITRHMSTSWPIGYAGCFISTATGADNVRFIARIYQQSEEETLAFVEDFAQLGPYLNRPLNTYSAGMHARLAFGTSLAMKFDCYLIDEGAGAGDERFRARSAEELDKRLRVGSLIMTSHDPHTLERYCDRGAVLYGGNLTLYDSVAEALEVHHGLQMRAA